MRNGMSIAKKIKRATLIALLVGSMSLPQTIYAADNSMNSFMATDQSINFGNGAIDKTQGGAIAWTQSYVLGAYMDIYDATGDREWLDKVIDQTDQTLAGASDDDGDSYYGWGESRYSHNQVKNAMFSRPVIGSDVSATELIVNGSFETNLNGWDQEGDSAKTYRSTAPGAAYSGSAGLIVESDGSNHNRLTQSLSYTPGAKYRVEVFAAVETQLTRGVIQVCLMVGTNCQLLGHDYVGQIGYERYVFNFDAPASGTVKIRLGLLDYSQSGFKARFDGISIKAVESDPAELVQNGGFEIPDTGDASLPKYWNRFQSNSATAYLVSGINKAFSSANGLAITNTSSVWKVLEQALSYTPSQSYTVSFRGRTADDRYGGRVEIYNATDSVVLGSHIFHDTHYEKYNFSFTAPAVPGKTVKIRLLSQSYANTGTFYFDEVSVVPFAAREPAAWTRASGSLPNAHINNIPLTGFNGAASHNWHLELTHDGTTLPRVSQYVLNYKPSSLYRFVIDAFVSAGATGAIRIVDETSSTVLASMTFNNNASLQSAILNFDTPVSGHTLRADIYMPSGSGGDKIYATRASASQVMDFLVHDALIGSALLRFVNAVYADPDLPPGYGDKADEYRDFVADHLFHKHDDHWRQITGTDGSNNGTGVYIFPELGESYFGSRSLPHNQYMAMARMLYLLYDATDGVAAYATDRPKYWSRANDMSRAFKSTLYPNVQNAGLSTDAYGFNYWDRMGSWDEGISYRSYEDLSHASLTLKGVREAYKHGQVFTYADMQKFARTFTDVMWNQSLTDPVLSNRNDSRPTTTAEKINTQYTMDWIDYAEFDHAIWEINAAVCEERCDITAAAGVAKWSRNKLLNGGMESADPADSTLPAFWQRWQSTSTTAYRDQTNPYRDTHAATVKTNAASWQVLEQTIADYELNTDYRVSFHGKTNGNVGGRVEAVQDSVVLDDTTFTDTGWTGHTFDFNTPAAAGESVRVRLLHNNYTPANGVAYYDQVRILPYLYNSHVPNGSFEIGDRFDNTLPRHWARAGTDSLINVSLDSLTHTSGGAAVKLTTDPSQSAQELYYMWKGYKKSGSYTLTVKGKRNNANGNGRVRVIDTSNGNAVLANVLIDNTNWTTFTAAFTAPASYDHVLKVVITHDDPAAGNGILWADDLGIYLN